MSSLRVRWLALVTTSLLTATSASARSSPTSTWEVHLDADKASASATFSAPALLLQRHISPGNPSPNKEQLERYARDRTGVRVDGVSCKTRSTRASLADELFTHHVEYSCPKGDGWELSNTVYATSRFNTMVLARIHLDEREEAVIFDGARTRWATPGQRTKHDTEPDELDPRLVVALVVAIIAAIAVLRRTQTRRT